MPASARNALLNQELSTQVLCASIADLLLKNQWLLATAESCTGGLIAAACTDLAGSSTWFERGFVTYSNDAKTELLEVDAALIAREGAVSESVVRAMVQGAVRHSHAQVAVAVTGVAGPAGGSREKPVGTVWFGWITPAGIASERCHFDGDRAQVRAATVLHALRGLLVRLQAAASTTQRDTF
jgi:nicotinamide-nucleotide amidase